ncbi:hypothetical protein CLG96_17875 [Sphingomonas oleivorans]|uniref:Transmembrane protein n=1 Tax=Sphingomonas oleivorans TaxID=1735121 RepID=A0A2T5FTL9_9SPHN|nr:hypothetical protein [Sphingomonas oleivorans]PTQ07412.1 hypothetical protein CLG96_17875 [Sphingomonas oleivorans]
MIGKLHARAQQLRATLWTMIVPPSAWAAHFLACYLLAAITCAKLGRTAPVDRTHLIVGGFTLLALLVIAASAFIAWAQRRIEGDPPPHDDSTDEDRLRFLATATLMLAALSAVAVIYVAASALFFEDCR